MIMRLTVLSLVILASGCGMLRPGIHGSGVSHSELRHVGPFEQVDLSGFGTVNIHVGPQPSVCVTTDDNLLQHVDTFVDGGKLKIKNRGRLRPKTGMNVDITVPHLTAAEVNGAGDLHVMDAAGESLDLSINGAGTVSATGCVNRVSTQISGAGDAELENLFAEHADVRVSGAGDIRVYASESIKARVAGAGDVICYGHPQNVDQRIAGAGDFVLKSWEGETAYSVGDAKQAAEDEVIRR